MLGYDKLLIFYYFSVAVKGENFFSFQGFQGPQPKFKDFPGPGIIFCFLYFSRTVATLITATHPIAPVQFLYIFVSAFS